VRAQTTAARFPRAPRGNQIDVQILAGVGVLVILVVVLSVLRNIHRGRRLRRTFGPEYTHVLATQGDREVTELELDLRLRRHRELPLRPLSEEARSRYLAWFEEIDAGFEEDQDRALAEAETLVVEILHSRGYPAESYQQSVADISVDDPEAAFEYRAAVSLVTRDTHPSGPSEQQLRTALMHYRTLVQRLLAMGEEFAADPAGASEAPADDRPAGDDDALNAADLVGFGVVMEGRPTGQVTGVTSDHGRAYLAVEDEGAQDAGRLVAASDVRDIDRDNRLVHLAPGSPATPSLEPEQPAPAEPADRRQPAGEE
jgi:hypothetical protein